MDNRDIWLTRTELRQYLKVSKSFLIEMLKEGKIKGRLFGKKKLMFNKAEIIEQLSSLPSQTISPVNENNLNG